MGSARYVLVNGDETWNTKPSLEHGTHSVTGGFRGDHDNVDVGRGLDLVVENRETVGEEESLTCSEVGLNVFQVDLLLNGVWKAERNQVGTLGCFSVGNDFESSFLGALLAAAAFIQANDYVKATVFEGSARGRGPAIRIRVQRLFCHAVSNHQYLCRK